MQGQIKAVTNVVIAVNPVTRLGAVLASKLLSSD